MPLGEGHECELARLLACDVFGITGIKSSKYGEYGFFEPLLS